MADIELVIKIPEGIYRRISQKYRYLTLDDIGLKTFDKVCVAIKDGTPLPKGHGRLGDLDALEKEMVNGIKAGNYEEGYERFPHINDMDDCVECVNYADTIIEADKERE